MEELSCVMVSLVLCWHKGGLSGHTSPKWRGKKVKSGTMRCVAMIGVVM